MAERKRRVLLYGDVDLAYVDGSAVWLTAMAAALSKTRSRVTVVLKARRRDGKLFDDLAAIEGIEILDDFASGHTQKRRYTPTEAATRLDELVKEMNVDVVICRGRVVCTEVAKTAHAGPRLWAYMTDIAKSGSAMEGSQSVALNAVALVARRIFVQTVESRDFMEFHVPNARGKTVLLYPMVEVPKFTKRKESTGPLRLVYSGKFAPDWKTLEMCRLPGEANSDGTNLEVTMIGEKVHEDPNLPTWSTRMREALVKSEGVTWLGGMSRAEAMRAVASCDLGLAWRATTLDTSHEISTKLLEYMAVGVPPLVNRTAMHEKLLGADYPFFIESDDVLSAIRRANQQPELVAEIASKLRESVSPFTVEARAVELESALRRADCESLTLRRPVTVMLAGSSSFCRQAATALAPVRGANPQIVSEVSVEDATYRPNTDDSSPIVVVAERLSSVPPEYLKSNSFAVWAYQDAFDPRSVTSGPSKSTIGALVSLPAGRRATALGTRRAVRDVKVVPPLFSLDEARRPKVNGAPYHVACVLENTDALEALHAFHPFARELAVKDPRYTFHLAGLQVATQNTLSVRPLSSLASAIHKFISDDLLVGRVAFEQVCDPPRWLRGIGWVYGGPRSAVPILDQAAKSGSIDIRDIRFWDSETATNASDGWGHEEVADALHGIVVGGKWQHMSWLMSRTKLLTDGSGAPGLSHYWTEVLESAIP